MNPTLALTSIVQRIDATLAGPDRADPARLRHLLRGLRQTAADALDGGALDSETVDLSAPLAPARIPL